jgi:GC-rich sequence DNA-binding factor
MDEDGFSTDSTLAEGDAEDYFAAHQHLEKRVVGLLDDVKAEDFRDPEKGVAVRFGDWRKRYEEEYVNAFGGLALVHAWEFWARGEMVGWEPLRVSKSPRQELSSKKLTFSRRRP